MSRWKLTVRHGSDVTRSNFDDLDDALGAARAAAEEIVSEGPLREVKAIRDYEPGQIVNARIEISGKGFFSPPTAGMDIQGDLSVIPYAGGVKRQVLDGDSIADAMRSLRLFLDP